MSPPAPIISTLLWMIGYTGLLAPNHQPGLRVEVNPDVWLPAASEEVHAAAIFQDRGRISVLVGDDRHIHYSHDPFLEAPDEISRELLLHHEAFHVLMQVVNQRFPSDELETRHRLTSPLAQTYLTSIRSELESAGSIQHAIGHVCETVISWSRFLPVEAHDDLRRLARWEWPAEYYAFSVMARAGRLDPERYRAARILMGRYDDYASGIVVGLVLDELSASSWQLRLGPELDMLTLLEESCLSVTVPMYESPRLP